MAGGSDDGDDGFTSRAKRLLGAPGAELVWDSLAESEWSCCGAFLGGKEKIS